MFSKRNQVEYRSRSIHFSALFFLFYCFSQLQIAVGNHSKFALSFASPIGQNRREQTRFRAVKARLFFNHHNYHTKLFMGTGQEEAPIGGKEC